MLQQGQNLAAMECYDKALGLNPQHIQALMNKASLLLIEGQIDKGKLYLKRILEIDPQNIKVENLLSAL